jgi:hypothetical protein
LLGTKTTQGAVAIDLPIVDPRSGQVMQTATVKEGLLRQRVGHRRIPGNVARPCEPGSVFLGKPGVQCAPTSASGGLTLADACRGREWSSRFQR